MIYLRTLRESQGVSQSDVGRVAGVEAKQVYRWERGENEPPASGLAAFARLVKGDFGHIAQLLLVDSDDVIDEEVALALAADRTEELRQPEADQQSRTQRTTAIIARLRAHPHRLDRWLGYGERLIDELADNG